MEPAFVFMDFLQASGFTPTTSPGEAIQELATAHAPFCFLFALGFEARASLRTSLAYLADASSTIKHL